MHVLIASFFLFFFGVFIGSFLKVLADRLPKSISPFGGRSYCEYCKHTLGALDLIPVFSFLFLGGKCRYCKRKLSLEYPISELLTGILFFLIFYLTFLNYEALPLFSGQVGIMNYGFWVLLLFNLFIISGLLVILFADIKYYIIPFQVLLPSLAIVVLWNTFMHPEMLMNYLLSGVIAFIFFLIIFLGTKRRGMGFGDVVLALYMGIFLGFPGIVVALYVAFLTGAVVSLILVLTRKKKLKGGIIPFGPFLVVGTVIAIFFGEFLGKIVLSYLYL